MESRGQIVISKILEVTGLTQVQLADHIGVRRGIIQDLARGRTKRLSNEVIASITDKFPNFNKFWLLSAEGDMYVEPSKGVTNIVNDGKNISNGAGGHAGDGYSADIVNRLLDELAAQREQNQVLIELLKRQIEG